MTRVYRDKTQLPGNMSANPAAVTTFPSPIPAPVSRALSDKVDVEETEPEVEDAESKHAQDQHKRQLLCPSARLRIHLEDLTNPATGRFTSIIPISTLLDEAILNVQHHLFTPPRESNEEASTSRPPQKPIKPKPEWKPQEVRSVSLVLRPMDGVAYTTGTNLDPAHKEIHLNLGYLDAKRDSSNADFLHEVRGVVTHEMVHVFQHNANGTCPGGLIEGMADYVRMKSGLGAKHWTKWPASERTRGKKWDEGYQKTAWFLEWLEETCRQGVIGELNEAMRTGKWDDGKLVSKVTGSTLDEWWKMYKEDWEPLNISRGEEQQG